uniref:Fis family transcriptional regulator n=1 Tax=Cryobacterium glaciale TaxID=1259145 RepID=A0A4R8V4L9_9MICO|nr:Fis family transcriptional regulator [Cryobacterium glaciale]
MSTDLHRHPHWSGIVTSNFDANLTQAIKEDFLGSTVPQEIRNIGLVESWQRSQAALGAPGNVGPVPHVPEALLDEHLLAMLGAPMNRFAEDLEGTGLALLLADSRGQILQRWSEDRQSRSHLDRVGTVRGAVLAENVVGTNGVGTVVATGASVQIRGTEHFADMYQDAVCTGAPVLHPITRKLLAVITLSCDMTPRSDLLKPLVKSLTAQLEQHLMSVEQPGAREMFSVFLDLSRKQNSPVVAFGPQGALIQSSTAHQLNAHDMNLLRSLGQEDRPSGRYLVELSSGLTQLDLTMVGQGNNVVVVGAQAARKTPSRPTPPAPRMAGRSPEWLAVVNHIDKLRSLNTPVILVGETGVGKTSLALGIPYKAGTVPGSMTLIDAAERHIVGTRQWLGRVIEATQARTEIVIRGIETLDKPALDGLRSLLDTRQPTAPLLLTLTADSLTDAEQFERRFDVKSVWIPPLRDRTDDLPDLWRTLADAVAPSAKLELTDRTKELLRAYSWPGNVKELRQLIIGLAARGKSGAIQPTDLPTPMQSAKTLTLIERMELEAIRKALQQASGNRVKAADILGISRATVYRKMKAYRLGT